jgi:LuxR family maltose regulon positive regulatory protein
LSIPCRNYIGIVESVFHQTRLAYVQGQLRLAESICRKGRTDLDAMLARPELELPVVGCLDVALGCIYLERNELDPAEQYLLHGLELIGWGLNPHFLMTACVGLFRLREIQGRSAEAIEYLARLEEAWPDMDFCARGLKIMHALREGPASPEILAEANWWNGSFAFPLDGDGLLPGMGPLGAAEAHYLAYLARVRVAIAAGQTKAALSYLKRQIDLDSSHGLAQRVIELSMLEALAVQAEGGSQRVWDALERALKSAPAEAYMRSFDQGPDSIQLLGKALERGICREKTGWILSGIKAGKLVRKEGSGQSGAQLPSPLSERELEVLHLLAQGVSNQEIAQQLVITVGTVKSHVNHILEKLDARNRTEAVARARNLHLLEI